MVNNKATTLDNDESDNEENVVVEMLVVMDDLRCHNQTLEDNVLHIEQRQREANLLEEAEIIDPRSLSDDIWGAPVPRNFKSLSLAKFDGRSNPYEHVTSNNIQMETIGAYDSLKF